MLEKKICCMALIGYHTEIVIKAVDEFILSPFNRSGLYAYDMERDKGFEPSRPAWKAGMLAVEHQSRRVRRLLKESLEL